MIYRYSLLLISLIFYLFSSNYSLAQNSKIFVIANIENNIITNLDLQRSYDFFIKTSNIRISSKSEKKFIINQLVEKLIEEELQKIEGDKLKISVDEAELEKALDEIAISQGMRDNNHLKRFFGKKRISYKQYYNQISTQLLWKKIISKTISPKIKVTQIDIDEMLELRNIDITKTSLKLAEILIPFNNEIEEKSSLSLATKLATEIDRENNFKNIARQFSKSSSSEYDGELGWIDESDLDQKIYDSIKNVQIGKVSSPIKTKNGYYIFKILDKKITKNISQQDEGQARQIIFNKKLKIAAKSYLQNIRKNSYVKVHEDKLRAF